MRVGTIETDIEESAVGNGKGSRLTASSGTSSKNSGDGGGGDGGPGNNGGGSSRQSEFDSVTGDKSRIITGFVLLVVLMTFGGLIGAYVVIATNRAIEWNPFDLPLQVWISTVIILFSSGTYELARRSIFRDRYDHARRFFVATAILGGVFIASQLVVWLELVNRGFYMQGNPYAGFFYILTAAHAIHVLGGVVALGSILLRSWYPTSNAFEIQSRRNLTTSVGWYWHFMGTLWVVLFILLGFWK